MVVVPPNLALSSRSNFAMTSVVREEASACIASAACRSRQYFAPADSSSSDRTLGSAARESNVMFVIPPAYTPSQAVHVGEGACHARLALVFNLGVQEEWAAVMNGATLSVA